jgi:hypothetical protein
VRPAIAAAAMLTVAGVPSVWLTATRPEVHTLHLLFVALILHRLLALRYAQDVEGTRRDIALHLGGVQHADTLAASRPLYVLRMSDAEKETLRRRFTLTPVATLRVSYGTVVPHHQRSLFRVEVKR